MQCKGGNRQLLARRIFITSAFKPEDLFTEGSEKLDQLFRRIRVVREFTPADERLMADNENVVPTGCGFEWSSKLNGFVDDRYPDKPIVGVSAKTGEGVCAANPRKRTIEDLEEEEEGASSLSSSPPGFWEIELSDDSD